MNWRSSESESGVGAVEAVLSAWWTYEDHRQAGEEALEIARVLIELKV